MLTFLIIRVKLKLLHEFSDTKNSFCYLSFLGYRPFYIIFSGVPSCCEIRISKVVASHSEIPDGPLPLYEIAAEVEYFSPNHQAHAATSPRTSLDSVSS